MEAARQRLRAMSHHLRPGPCSAPDVHADVSYLRPSEALTEPGERVRILDPPPELLDVHRMPVRDARPLPSSTEQLDTMGFVLASHTSDVDDLYSVHANRGEEQARYWREMEEVACQLTGAKEAHVFNTMVRLQGSTDRGVMPYYSPAPHCDYTALFETGEYFYRIVGKQLELGHTPPRNRRFCVVNIWRPITPSPSLPLIVCDARTVDSATDAVGTELRFPNGLIEAYRYKHNAKHEWWWVPAMTAQEVLAFKTYDSVDDGSVARFTPHCAVADPNAAADAPPRQSVEARCFCLF